MTSNNEANQPSSLRRIFVMFTLIVAGEAVFLLPFVIARIFRPTFLEVFDINNLQLGLSFSVYGTIAMVAYFAGGPIADRFSARRLMTVALITTGTGGILLVNRPSLSVLTVLYGFWGLTTILLFWAALIRATREWGGASSQGRAYGLLDGGRGLVAALLATITVTIFESLLPVDVPSATVGQKSAALMQVIWIFIGLTFTAAALVWIFVPDSQQAGNGEKKRQPVLAGVREVMGLPVIWLQAIIILCAYVSYKGTDDFSLYAYDAFGYDDVAAARIGTISFWMRPLAAIGAGLLADRVTTSKVTASCFGILLLGSLVIAFDLVLPGIYWMLAMTVAGTSVGIYALRGIYYALFQEAKIPLAVTGSAVGLVSVIGYTPDIFMGPLMGYLIDRSPGALGHQHVFGVLAGFALIGLIASLIFGAMARRR